MNLRRAYVCIDCEEILSQAKGTRQTRSARNARRARLYRSTSGWGAHRSRLPLWRRWGDDMWIDAVFVTGVFILASQLARWIAR